MVGIGCDQRRTLRDFVTLGVQGISSSISWPTIEVNNLELKPTLISMVQQSQFVGTPLEDQNLPSLVFLVVCDTLKLSGASIDVICLCLFPFSLRNKVKAWLHALPPGCITTWDELTKVFLTKLFPPSRMVSLRNQITTFSQKEDKTLYVAWELSLIHI